MLKRIFEQVLEDLRQIKKDGFQLPKKMGGQVRTERPIAEMIGPLPKNLRDPWLLWIYYSDNPHRFDAGIHGRTENEMKRQIVYNVLYLYLAHFSPDAFYTPFDFWVDRDWTLFVLKKDDNGLRAI